MTYRTHLSAPGAMALFCAAALALVTTPALADDGARTMPRGQLVSQIDYRFVGHLGQFDKQGRLLVWEGYIDGDVSGEIRWWFSIPSTVVDSLLSGDGRIAYYEGYWEISRSGRRLLAGVSAGKTVFTSPTADGVWDGHGVVTHGWGRFARLRGRRISETGPVILGDTPPVTFNGTGLFLVY